MFKWAFHFLSFIYFALAERGRNRRFQNKWRRWCSLCWNSIYHTIRACDSIYSYFDMFSLTYGTSPAVYYYYYYYYYTVTVDRGFVRWNRLLVLHGSASGTLYPALTVPTNIQEHGHKSWGEWGHVPSNLGKQGWKKKNNTWIEYVLGMTLNSSVVVLSMTLNSCGAIEEMILWVLLQSALLQSTPLHSWFSFLVVPDLLCS